MGKTKIKGGDPEEVFRFVRLSGVEAITFKGLIIKLSITFFQLIYFWTFFKILMRCTILAF